MWNQWYGFRWNSQEYGSPISDATIAVKKFASLP
jgi:hypothetical protein